MTTDFKHKAYKYEKKYFDLIKQIGGGKSKPLWYDKFENSLKEIDGLLNNNEQQHILTGTSAIIYILYELQIEPKILDEFDEPDDIDYLYEINNLNNSNNHGNFNKINIVDSTSNNKKISYLRQPELPNMINKFDLMCVYHIKYSKIGKYDVVNINTLYNMYLFNNKDKNKFKINALEKIINYVKKNNMTDIYQLE